VRHVPDIERRTRLVRRHALAADHRVGDAVAAAEAVVCLHATEPASVHLAVAARSEGVSAADVDAALYDERSLVKQLAMRRTLFVFPRDLLAAAWGSASARVETTERKRITKDVTASGLADDADAWLKAAGDAVLSKLADGPLSAQQLRELVPEIAGTVRIGSPGAKWGGDIPIGPRVLGHLGARGDIMRGRNSGHWRTSRPAWSLTSQWLDEVPDPLPAEEGYAELVRRWLRTFGPGTTTDLSWWMGWPLRTTRQALADCGAVEVRVGGGPAWLAPDDEPPAAVEPWVAVLPGLDPTTMGWKERDWYLPAAAVDAFDSVGNGGPTLWVDGRIVGAWAQTRDGEIHTHYFERVPAIRRRQIDARIAEVKAMIGDTRFSLRFPGAIHARILG